MSNSQVQVFMPKEKADELKTKYNLSEETIQKVISGLKVAPGAPASASTLEQESEEGQETGPEIFTKLGRGEITMGEALIYLDYQDRKEERRKATSASLTPEAIAKAVAQGIKEAMPPTPKTDDEMPAWAKDLQTSLAEIKGRQDKEEDEERLRSTVNAAVQPIQQGLAKTQEELAKTKEGLEASQKPAKGELETTKETLQTLKEIDDLRGKGEQPAPPKPRELIIDLNEEVANALGDEIKNTIVSAVKEKLSGEGGTPAVTTTPDGKVQVEWYKLGKDILNTVNRFIEKLPVAAPPKVGVKEMPPPGKPPQLPTPPPTAPPITPTPAPTTQTPTQPTSPPSPPSTMTVTPPAQIEVATSTTETAPPPPTQEVATATIQKEEPKSPEPETKGTWVQIPPPGAETEVEETPQKPSKKNEEQKEEAKAEKQIIAESPSKEVVVEQETLSKEGSEETLHGKSDTARSRRKSTESD